MKKLAILMMLMICSNSFTQKKELRQINKLISESFFNEAESSLEAISSIIEVSDDKIKAQYYFYLAKVSNELEKSSINEGSSSPHLYLYARLIHI